MVGEAFFVLACYHFRMLIGIEATRANRLQKTGVEWYAYHVIQEMKKLPEAADASWLLYSNDPLSMGLEQGPSNWHERRLAWPPKYLWTQLRLSWEMWRRPPEVLFVPAHVLPRVIPKRTVVTIHDIGFHRMPMLYKQRQVTIHEQTTKDIVRRASRIITPSEFSKRELVEAYHADPAKVFVTPLGVDDIYQPMSAEKAAPMLAHLQVPSPFAVFVGRLEEKKNIGMLIEAFHRYKETRGVGDPLHLVLVGQPGLGYERFEKLILEGPLRDFIHVVGYVNEDEKIALLSSASALIHPAWYEGFCIPPIEAMACGCPVIASNVASIPEVVGEENALWFSPFGEGADGLARKMGQLMDDPSLQASLREKGLAWSKRYRWQETARRTLSLLTSW